MVVEPKVCAPHQPVLTASKILWSQTTLTKSGHVESSQSQVHFMFDNCKKKKGVWRNNFQWCKIVRGKSLFSATYIICDKMTNKLGAVQLINNPNDLKIKA